MNIKQTKDIPLIELLAKLNIFPAKISGDLVMYFAINRQESTPSLSINLKKNTALDFGTGKVYDVVSLVQEICNCSVQEALKIISEKNFSSFQTQTEFNKKEYSVERKNYKIVKIKNIVSHTALLSYLQERQITQHQDYFKEIHYEVKNSNNEIKKYFGIAFQNDSGGFEVRNKYCKVCIGKKDITSILGNYKCLRVFEGFIDFHSYLSYNEAVNWTPSDFVILNSNSLVHKIRDLLANYTHVELFLDNDESGSEATCKILSWHPNTQDLRFLYSDFKDFNDFWVVHKQNEFSNF